MRIGFTKKGGVLMGQVVGKGELVDKVVRSANVPEKVAANIVDDMLFFIEFSLKSGNQVRLPGIGTLEIIERKARKGRNPKTGAAISISEKPGLRFRASKKFFEKGAMDMLSKE